MMGYMWTLRSEGSIEIGEVAIVSRNGGCLSKRMAKESSQRTQVD